MTAPTTNFLSTSTTVSTSSTTYPSSSSSLLSFTFYIEGNTQNLIAAFGANVMIYSLFDSLSSAGIVLPLLKTLVSNDTAIALAEVNQIFRAHSITVRGDSSTIYALEHAVNNSLLYITFSDDAGTADKALDSSESGSGNLDIETLFSPLSNFSLARANYNVAYLAEPGTMGQWGS